MGDLSDLFTLFVIICLLQKANNVLEGFKVASQSDLDALFFSNALYHGPKMLNIIQRPLFVEVHDAIIMPLASFDNHFNFCKVKWLLLPWCRILICFLRSGLGLMVLDLRRAL